jgi:hypothetical protein
MSPPHVGILADRPAKWRVPSKCPPFCRASRDIRVDLDEWKQFGSGGFGAVYSNAAEPSHVLKQLYGEVSLADSLRAKKEHSSHARVIRERLSAILGGQASDFESRIRGQLHDAVTSHVGYSQSSGSVYLYQRLAMGMPLQAAYQHDAPSWITRLKVAQNFAAAMDELCRCRVIHLDCGASNVFVDLQAGDPRVYVDRSRWLWNPESR